MASARILQRSAATIRAIGAPVNPVDAHQMKPDEGDRKDGSKRHKRVTGDANSGRATMKEGDEREGEARQKRAMGGADSGGGDRAYRRPKGRGDDSCR